MLKNLDRLLLAYARTAEHMDDNMPCSCHWSILATLTDAVDDFRAFLAYNSKSQDILPLGPPTDLLPGDPELGDTH
jgi:hypothetical protein